MPWLEWIVFALAVVVAGWLAFDGAHAFATGDYVTPKAGTHAGQLGPWSKVVGAIGIEPRSTLMKSVHLGLGLVWLGISLCFALGLPWARTAMLACAVAGLWYLPFGTLFGIVQIVLLGLVLFRSR
ncbi:MAG: hypothetical protein R3E12_14320 [Candidatus Eisenbacteria bacterium]